MILADSSEAEAGLHSVCQQGRELGFDGKSLVHPKQLPATNSAFSPSAADINLAAAVIKAHAAATAAGKGVCVVGGKLVEALHVQAAHALLERVGHIEQKSHRSESR